MSYFSGTSLWSGPTLLVLPPIRELKSEVRVPSAPPQLGPNPSFLDGEKLSRGQSGKLTHGGTLYLVNQDYPFKLHFSLSSNGAGSSSAQAGLNATDRTKGAKGEAPKRSIKDFFSTSPMMVTNLFLHVLQRQTQIVCFVFVRVPKGAWPQRGGTLG